MTFFNTYETKYFKNDANNQLIILLINEFPRCLYQSDRDQAKLALLTD